MDSKELRGLLEAYSEVYAPKEIEEAVKGQSSETRRDMAAERKAGDKRLSPSAGKANADKMERDIKFYDKVTKKTKPSVVGMTHEENEIEEAVKGQSSETRRDMAAERRRGIKPLSAKEGEKYASHKLSQMAYAKRKRMGEEIEEVGEATAMAKRGYDEAPIRQKIAKSTGGGKAADRATALEKKPTFGDANKEKQRQNLARAQRGDFRKTTSSSPGLHGYAHKSDNAGVKAKQAARGAQRGALTPNEKKELNREEFDIFDVVLEFLQAEGYAETLEEAQELMTAVVLEAQAARNNPEKYERESRKSETKGQSAERRVRDRLKTMDPKRAEAMKAQMRAVGLNV